MPEPILLLNEAEPVFKYQKIDGTPGEFNPWEFMAAMEAAPDGMVGQADTVRRFLGLPTSDTVQQGDALLGYGACTRLQTAVMEFIANLPDTKKKLALLQKLSPTDATRHG